YTVPEGAAGTYVIRVTAENGTRGEYFLDPVATPATRAVELVGQGLPGTEDAAVVAARVQAVLSGTSPAEAAASVTAAPVSSQPLPAQPLSLSPAGATPVAATTTATPAVTVVSVSPTVLPAAAPTAVRRVDAIGLSGGVAEPDGDADDGLWASA